SAFVRPSGGERRTVDAADLKTGNADAGKRYFTGAGGCVRCHSLSGPFASVGSRFEGLPLLQRMLYPRLAGAARTKASLPIFTVTTGEGETISGKLAYRDEFSITLLDPDGWSRSWPTSVVKIEGEDPLRAHAEQLAKYTDDDIHDVLAFLQTLK
ncbi:MAG: c-type cytochrome, partial [Acidobacteriia bacterium]|nr:c-type cytochrome [Terriglobia bacterium]